MKEVLTNREKEIAKLISWGASAKEIAEIIDISNETVREHIKHIKFKIGINKMTEISAYMFCTEYNVPSHLDKIGRIKKIVSTLVCVFAFALVEYQQVDFIRTTATRAIARNSVRSTRIRRGKDNNYLTYEHAFC